MYPSLLRVVLLLGVVTAAGPVRALEADAVPEGSVKAVKDGLILISIGSEHGLKVGDSLEVYRTSPEPAYCGRLRLLNVGQSQAVGRLTIKTKEQVRVNDRVTGSLKAEHPTPEDGNAGKDLLRATRARMQIEEQLAAQAVEASLREARQRHSKDPDAARKVIRETLLRILDNAEISESVRNNLLRRVVEVRRKLGEQGPDKDGK